MTQRASLPAAVAMALVVLPSITTAQTPDAMHRDALRWPTGTFSILAMDPATGEMGGAVQSRVFSVGNGVLWAEAGLGVVATQAIVDVSYGPQALDLLRAGRSAEQVVTQVLANDPDPDPENWPKEGRQFAVLDAQGRVFAYTGPKATEWAGNKSCAAPHVCTAQGNILAGPGVVDSMVAAFERTEGPLRLRLVAALDGGQRAGGDHGAVGEADAFEKFGGALAGGVAPERPGAEGEAGDDIVETRHRFQHAYELERAANAEAGDLVGRETADRLAAQADFAAVGFQGAGDEVEDGGLAGAGLTSDETDGAQLQQMLQAHLGLGERGGDEQVFGLRGQIEGKGGQGEVFAVHQRSSSGVSGRVRSFRPEGGGSGAGVSVFRVQEGRLRLTKQLA